MLPSRLAQVLALTCSLLLLAAFVAYRARWLDLFITDQPRDPFSTQYDKSEWYGKDDFPVTEIDTPRIDTSIQKTRTLLSSSKSIVLIEPAKTSLSKDTTKITEERTLLSSSKSGPAFPPTFSKEQDSLLRKALSDTIPTPKKK